MYEHSNRRHVVDLLFPLALFFVLAVSAVALVILASGQYSQQVTDSNATFSNSTALSYVTEKIHQNDENGNISLGTFDGQESLIISQTYNEQTYITYLYLYEGYLRELFIQKDVQAAASDGRKILEVQDFSFEESQPGIILLTCSSDNGTSASTIVSIKSSSN